MPRMGLRKSVDAIAKVFRVGQLKIAAREASSIDPFVKYMFECEDGSRIESVRIPLEKQGRFVVCVSSQVGCALGCTFCATGRLGLQRNLEAWEIVEQVRQIRNELPSGTRIHGVVFQGMGEPLANVDRVIAAIEVLHHPCGGAIDQRAITVCTVGIPHGIRRLARSTLRVRLGISIGSARRNIRKQLMPIEQANPLDEVLDATVEYVQLHGDSPMFAITTLAGVNTSNEDAQALAKLVHSFRARTGIAPRISLIPYNTIGPNLRTGELDPFTRTTHEESDRFRAQLAAIGVPVVRRYSGGGDVNAACGQLAARGVSNGVVESS